MSSFCSHCTARWPNAGHEVARIFLFQGQMLYKMTKPWFNFLCLFCVVVVVSFGLLVHVWFCFVTFSYYGTYVIDWLTRILSEMQWWANPNRDWDLRHDLNTFSDSIWSITVQFKRSRFDLRFDLKHLRFDSKKILYALLESIWNLPHITLHYLGKLRCLNGGKSAFLSMPE